METDGEGAQGGELACRVGVGCSVLVPTPDCIPCAAVCVRLRTLQPAKPLRIPLAPCLLPRLRARCRATACFPWASNSLQQSSTQ